MGLFVVFEGGDGAGKSTHVRHLYGLLSQHGYRSKFLREPGGTALGEYLRAVFLPAVQAPKIPWGRTLLPPLPTSQLVAKELFLPLCAHAELFLFLSSRAQLVSEVIRPSLSKGTIILCDRFTHSTLAYQGYGRGLDLGMLRHLNSVATEGLEPNLVVLLDIEPSKALPRHRRSGTVNRFDLEEAEFHRRVRQGYLEMAAADPRRWLVVDTSQPRPEVARRIWERVQAELAQAGIKPQSPKRRRAGSPEPEDRSAQQSTLGNLEP